MLKTIPFLLETMQCPINKPQRRFILVLETGKTKMTKISKNLKNLNFVKKKCKNVLYGQVETYSMATKKLSVAYYPTPDEIFWPLVLKKLN